MPDSMRDTSLPNQDDSLHLVLPMNLNVLTVSLQIHPLSLHTSIGRIRQKLDPVELKN